MSYETTARADIRRLARRPRHVLPAKSKAIAQDMPAAGVAGFVRDVVEIAIAVGRLVVDRRRQSPVAQGHQADDQFSHTGGREQMARHALGARDGRAIGLAAEDLLDRRRLDLVVGRRARAVGVDVVDIRRG